MSSHHIIREKQEPALLVLGLNHFTDELLGQLLEWSPTLIVTSDTAEQINAYGIKFDVLVGSATDERGLQSDTRFIQADGDTIVTAALQYLVAGGYPAVNVVTDVLNLSVFEPYVSQINLVIFSEGYKIYPVTSGFSKWKPAGDQIKILNAVTPLLVSGLSQLSDKLYQTISDGFFTLQFDEPYLFIAESLT